MFGGFFVEGNPIEDKGDHQKNGQNHHVSINSPELTHFANSFSILTVNNKKIPTVNVNAQNSDAVFGVKTLTPINPAPMAAAAEKLINNPDSALSQASDNLFINNNLSRENFIVNKGRWTKVIYLKVGDEIAVLCPDQVLWAKINSLEFVGYERVYDLGVEGTHNFVAGHWVEGTKN